MIVVNNSSHNSVMLCSDERISGENIASQAALHAQKDSKPPVTISEASNMEQDTSHRIDQDQQKEHEEAKIHRNGSSSAKMARRLDMTPSKQSIRLININSGSANPPTSTTTVAQNQSTNQQRFVERLIDSELEWRPLICELNGLKSTDELIGAKRVSEWQLKRQEVIHELIITERHHCLTLALMRQVYVASLRKLNEARLKSPSGPVLAVTQQSLAVSPSATPIKSATSNWNGNNNGSTTISHFQSANISSGDSAAAAMLLMGGDLIDLERLFPALDDLIQAHELFFAHLRLLLVESCRAEPLGFVGPVGRLLTNQFRLCNSTTPSSESGHHQSLTATSVSSPDKSEPERGLEKEEAREMHDGFVPMTTTSTTPTSSTTNSNTSYGHKLLAAYTKFCGQQSNSNRYYKHLMQNDRGFKNVIESIEQQQSSAPTPPGGQGAASLARRRGIAECNLLVAQRLTKYPLLIEQLIKTSKDEESGEVEDLREALAECRNLLTELNSQLARKESFERLLDIYANFSLKSHTIYNHRTKFTKHNLLQHKRLRQLLHLDDQLRLWSATRRKLFQIVCLVLNDLVVFLRTEQQHGTSTNALTLAAGSSSAGSSAAALASSGSSTSGAGGNSNSSQQHSASNNENHHPLLSSGSGPQQESFAASTGSQSALLYYDHYGSLTPALNGSQSGNGLVYYFANVDNKSSVISLSKLLVREKAQMSDSGEPRLYLISSSVRQPEMYELAFTSKRHQTTFVQKLKSAIEMRRRDLSERSTCRHPAATRCSRPGPNNCAAANGGKGASGLPPPCRRASSDQATGGGKCQLARPLLATSNTDCSIGWSPTSSCTSDEDYYHYYDEQNSNVRQGSLQNQAGASSPTTMDSDDNEIIDSEDYDAYLDLNAAQGVANQREQQARTHNHNKHSHDRSGELGQELEEQEDDDAIYTGDNEDDGDADQDEEETSDGFEYDELEPVGDHLSNLDIADARQKTDWKKNKSRNRRSAATGIASPALTSTTTSQFMNNLEALHFDIEQDILVEPANNEHTEADNDDATTRIASKNQHHLSDYNKLDNGALMSNESGLSERARDSMDESAASGRPRVRANQRRRRLQRLRNVSNQSSSSSEPSQHRQALSQLLNLANVVGNHDDQSVLTHSKNSLAVNDVVNKLSHQDENEDSGRGLDLDSSASSSAGSTSNTLASISNASSKGSSLKQHQHHSSMVTLNANASANDNPSAAADPTGAGSGCNLCQRYPNNNEKNPDDRIGHKTTDSTSKASKQSSKLASTSADSCSACSSSLNSKACLSSQAKLSKSHCSLLIRKPTSALGSVGLIGSFKSKQNQPTTTTDKKMDEGTEVKSKNKERKLSTVSSLSSQVKLFNRLRSSNYSVSSSQKATSTSNSTTTTTSTATSGESSLCTYCKTRCAQDNASTYQNSLVRHPNRRTALFVPEQKLEQLRDLQIQLNKDKQEWQTKYERMQEDLLNERRKLDLAYERLKLDQQQVANEREQFYRKLDVLKENGILLTPSHKVHIMNHNLTNQTNNNIQQQQLLQIQQQMCNYATAVHFSDITTSSTTTRQQQQQALWHHHQQQQKHLQQQHNNNQAPYFQHNIHNQSTSININAANQATMDMQQHLHQQINYKQQQHAMWRPKQQSLVIQSSNHPGATKVPIHLANEQTIGKTTGQQTITAHHNSNNNPNKSLGGSLGTTMTRSSQLDNNRETNVNNPNTNNTSINGQHLSSKVSNCLGLSTRIPLLSALGVSFLGERQSDPN